VTVTASGLTKGRPRWQDAINAADAVINSGQYTLEPNWKKNFAPDNHDSKENIFYISNTDAQPGPRHELPASHAALQSARHGWRPMERLRDARGDVQRVRSADARRSMFLVGQQYSFDTNLPVKDRAGNSAVFSITIRQRDPSGGERGSEVQQVPPKPGVPMRAPSPTTSRSSAWPRCT
jgi:hypothetical protein